MSCATSADALLGGGIVSAAGLRVVARQLRDRLPRRTGAPDVEPAPPAPAGAPVSPT